jgi:hypothetical protein
MRGDDAIRQDAADPKSTPARPRKRTPKPAAADAGKRSLNLRIDQDSYQRLNVHALMRGTTVSELVMGYARTLKEFSVHRHAGAGQGPSDGS